MTRACAALLAIGAACGTDHGADGALRALAPHAEHFAAFERWTERALDGEASFGSRAALEEALFSQVRDDDAVLAVRLDRDGSAPLGFRAAGALPDDGYVAIRDARLGAVEIARTRVADRDAIVVRRAGPEGRTLRIAYAAP
jgi:hypothetical protein